jgi:hypothetical protein
MVALELRDPGAGVVVRSFRPADVRRFLLSQIRAKGVELKAIRHLDPTSAAILGAEVRRLEELLSIVGAEANTRGTV